MRIIPNIIHSGTISNAERKIFDLLKNLDMGSGWTAFHSLNVSEHQYKQWSELDFVIVGPEGIIVLEVKGGGVACENGIWYFTDRYGIAHKRSEGPFKQAESGAYALRDKISEKYGKSWLERIKTGCWGVVFPDITFTQSSPEMPKQVICDERYTKNVDGFKRYIKKLISYWNGKGRRITSLEPDDELFNNISKYLRPNFDVSPSLHNRVDAIHQSIVQHTNEQYRYIDALELNDRIICSGGAGTGKSFLAVETGRREIENGYRVLLVAWSAIFVEYLKIQIEHPSISIYTFSELSDLVDSNYNESFDVLIVDEGQDLMSLDCLDVFDLILKKGIANGRWRWFMDENSQAGILGFCDKDELKDALDMLMSTAPVYMPLKYNCRNTKQIVSETELTTGANIGVTEIKGNGPRVEYCQVSDMDDEVYKLTAHLELLLTNGVPLSDIVILSPVNNEYSVVEKLSAKWKKRLYFIDKINVTEFLQEKLLVSSVANFKGLERRFVILVDTSMLDGSVNSVSLLYVAMTRAHAGLWIAVDDKFKLILLKMQENNIKKK
jgi:hypothetical protein